MCWRSELINVISACRDLSVWFFFCSFRSSYAPGYPSTQAPARVGETSSWIQGGVRLGRTCIRTAAVAVTSFASLLRRYPGVVRRHTDKLHMDVHIGMAESAKLRAECGICSLLIDISPCGIPDTGKSVYLDLECRYGKFMHHVQARHPEYDCGVDGEFCGVVRQCRGTVNFVSGRILECPFPLCTVNVNRQRL